MNLVFAVLVFILDRVTKQLAPAWGLRVFVNPTFAFGIPGGNMLAIILSTLVALALVAVVVLEYRRRRPNYQLLITSYSIILAGAAGNLADRIIRGGTVDWLVVGPWTINLADLAIVTGVVLILTSAKRKVQNVK